MATVAHPHRSRPDPDALRGILDDHAQWLASGGARGTRADLSGADLADADLSGINLTRAVLTGADLSRADLCHTILDFASMARATLVGAELRAATLIGADLTWADLSEADLTDADLSEAVLPDAELAGATLSRANLTGAEMDGADLTGANVDGAILTGADMSGARFTDDGMDAAFEADQVHDPPALTPVSELPDADLEAAPGEDDGAPSAAPSAAGAASEAAPGAAPPPAEPHPEPPPPGGPADRLAQLAARLAAHREWLQSDGARGTRADLADLAPLPLAALAGADLSHATLPGGDPLGPAIAHARTLAAGVNRALGATLFACLYAALALTPALMARGAPVRLPLFGTLAHPILVALALPLMLLLSHLWLHGALQRLARACARLPRRLPDGSAPLAPDWHLPYPRGGHLPIWSGMRWFTRGLAFGAVPGILSLYAGAFSTHATVAGTVILAFLTAAAAGVSMFSLLRLRRRG